MSPKFKFKIPMGIILDMDARIFAAIPGDASPLANA
jgi:hypothetical protein